MTVVTTEDIDRLRRGGHILAQILKKVLRQVKAGMSTQDVDRIAAELIQQHGAHPSFKGYQGYPAATCVSLNEEIVHGLPREQKIIKEGDIVTVDVGIEYQGMFTDTAATVPVGKISREAKKLIKVTKKALGIGLKEAKPGNRIGDIGYAIQQFAERHGFSVVRALTGHGVGRAVHEEPKIPNFGEKGKGTLIESGMVLAIEPMVTAGSYDVRTLDDSWTVVTADGSWSAHFEYTVLVTEKGCEILTK